MKTTKLILLTILLGASFLATTGNVSGQSESLKIKPGKKFTQSGAKLASPNDRDWRVTKSAAMETAFSKVAAEKKFDAFVKTAGFPVYGTHRELLENLEKLKIAEVDEKNRDSIHFNYTEFKSTPCLQYDGIFNAPGTVYKYWNVYGYICRHPAEQGVIIQFEFSAFSNERGFVEAETALSKGFFEAVKFARVK